MFLVVIEALVKNSTFFYCWLDSEFFNENLKLLYGLHLPTQPEWKTSLECVYHEYLPNCQDLRSKYTTNFMFKV